jgi:hypothetical protein
LRWSQIRTKAVEIEEDKSYATCFDEGRANQKDTQGKENGGGIPKGQVCCQGMSGLH